jgi:ssDNA-binding Zn-finger/Zn-ribbon topoisomerase 1
MNKKEALKTGYKYYCMECNATYKELPNEEYEDGHGGRYIVICPRCGCDLFANLVDDTPAVEI